MKSEARKQYEAAWRTANRERNCGYSAKYYAANKAKCKAANLAWQEKNPGRKATLDAAWAAANPDSRRLTYEKYRRQNRDVRNAQMRAQRAATGGATQREWRLANPGRAAAHVRRYQAAKLRATPAWADHDLIIDIYEYAAIMRKHRVDCQVDHIEPLRGKRVSGLHTDANLTVLLTSDNRSKGNRRAEA